jgi:hypothetical protein
VDIKFQMVICSAEILLTFHISTVKFEEGKQTNGDNCNEPKGVVVFTAGYSTGF